MDGSQVGWTYRAPGKKWSQQIVKDVQPRFTTYHPGVLQAIYSTRKICIVEGAFDMLAVAPAIPWVISTNTSRVAQEVLEWIKDWKLHTFTGFDFDKKDPKTGQTPGQDATFKITQELTRYGCPVTNLDWNEPSLKDPAQAFAAKGSLFHKTLTAQVHRACGIYR
jgi:hypothetical protein